MLLVACVTAWGALLVCVLSMLFKYRSLLFRYRCSLFVQKDKFTWCLLILPPPLLCAAAISHLIGFHNECQPNWGWNLGVGAGGILNWMAITALALTGNAHNKHKLAMSRQPRGQEPQQRLQCIVSQQTPIIIPSEASVAARVLSCVAAALFSVQWYCGQLLLYLEDSDSTSSSDDNDDDNCGSGLLLVFHSCGLVEVLIMAGFALTTTGMPWHTMEEDAKSPRAACSGDNRYVRLDDSLVEDATLKTNLPSFDATQDNAHNPIRETSPIFENDKTSATGVRTFQNCEEGSFSRPDQNAKGHFDRDSHSNQNPEFASCLLSQLTFSWVTPILDRGLLSSLEHNDLYLLVDEDQCAVHARIIAAAWQHEIEACRSRVVKQQQRLAEAITDEQGFQSQWWQRCWWHRRMRNGTSRRNRPLSKSTSLMRTLLWRSYGSMVVTLAAMRLLGIVATYAQPMMLDRLLRAIDMEKQTTDEDDGDGRRRYRFRKERLMIGYSAGLFICNILSSLLDSQCEYWMTRTSTRARLGLMHLVFGKALRLTGKAKSELGAGAVVSHMGPDCRIISQGFPYVNQVWSIPVQILVCLALLYQQLGVAAFTGLAITAVLTPAIFVVTREQRKARRKVMKCRDKRIKFFTEVMQGAKTIKLNAWENKARQEVSSRRASEVKMIRRTQLLGALSQFLVISLPSFVCICTFTAFTALNANSTSKNNNKNDDDDTSELTAARVFTSLALLGLLSTPLAQIPTVLSGIIGMLVSSSRINDFLHAEEYTETFVLGYKEVPRYTIHNGNGIDFSELLIEETANDASKMYGESSAEEYDALVQRRLYWRYIGSNERIRIAVLRKTPIISTQTKPNILLDKYTCINYPASCENVGHHFDVALVKANDGDGSGREIGEAASTVIAVERATFCWPTISGVEEDEVSSREINVKKYEIDSKKRFGGGKSGERRRSRRIEMGLKSRGGIQRRSNYSQILNECSIAPSIAPSPVFKNLNLTIIEGQLVAVVGRVGAGKSTLLAGLINELSSSIPKAYNPTTTPHRVFVSGSLAYCAQEPWIRNASVRDNIRFSLESNSKSRHPRRARATNSIARENMDLRVGDDDDNNIEETAAAEARYERVLDCCALLPDLAMLPDGDETLIGERGLNLSGGQKARVALARAAYADADIYILDDPLSAVDAHVANHLLEKLLLPPYGLLAGNKVNTSSIMGKSSSPFENRSSSRRKTIVIATNHLGFLKKADQIIVVGGDTQHPNGVLACGSIEELRAAGIDPCTLIASETSVERICHREIMNTDGTSAAGSSGSIPNPDKATSVDSSSPSAVPLSSDQEYLENSDRKKDKDSCRLDDNGNGHRQSRSSTIRNNEVDKEVRLKGEIGLQLWLGYLRALGSHWVVLVIMLYIFSQTLRTLGDWVLADWTLSSSSTGIWARVPRICGLDRHLTLYASLLLLSALLVFLRALALVFANVRACRKIHDSALWAVLRSPMSFFDTTPSGRVLNRFSSDLQQVDMQLRNQISYLFNSSFQLVAGVAVVLSATPVVVVCLVPLAFAYHRTQLRYRTSAREVQRLQSLHRSPILQMVSEVLTNEGLPTVRAFRKSGAIHGCVERMENDLGRCLLCGSSLRRWLELRLEAFGSFVVLAVALASALEEICTSKGANAALVGLSLSYAIKTTRYLNGFMTSFADAEVGLVAFERLKEYANLPLEPPMTRTLQTNIISTTSNDNQGKTRKCLRFLNWFRSSNVDHVNEQLELEPLEARSSAMSPTTSNDTTMNPMTMSSSSFDPPTSWPERGSIKFEEVVMAYRPELSPVLQGLSFSVEAGTTVGIVGRTGSGKSSIFNALLRLTGGVTTALQAGRIIVDGVDISNVGVHTLRSRIIVIPQDPVLFSGSLRYALDPFGERSDETLWCALEQVGLASIVLDRLGLGKVDDVSAVLHRNDQKETIVDEEDQYSLDKESEDNAYFRALVKAALDIKIEPYAENLSVGQRQLVCIARALVRRGRKLDRCARGKEPYHPCIVLLDEATASIDHRTDGFIQRILRRVFIDEEYDTPQAFMSLSPSTQHRSVPPSTSQTSISSVRSPCTLLAIAHRLETIRGSDRILVMDHGRAVEYDSPNRLLANPASEFSALYFAATHNSH